MDGLEVNGLEVNGVFDDPSLTKFYGYRINLRQASAVFMSTS